MLDSEHENQGPSSRTCSSPNVFAGGYRDSFSVAESDETCYAERAGVSEHEMPSYSVGTSSNPSLWKDDDYSQIKHVVDDVESECMQNHYWLIIRFPSLFLIFVISEAWAIV